MRLSWLSHIAVRYAAMLAATLVPLAILIIAYDRYASSPLDVISGTRAEQRIAGETFRASCAKVDTGFAQKRCEKTKS